MAVTLGIVIASWVIVPLVLRRRAVMTDLTPGAVIDARARRRIALASLKEVEYDRVAGKLDEEDYRRLKAQLEREALAAIQLAEATDDGSASAAGDQLTSGSAEPTEAAAPATAAVGGHSCGFVNPAGSRFCAGCGQPLT